jgi:hypothetical protein
VALMSALVLALSACGATSPTPYVPIAPISPSLPATETATPPAPEPTVSLAKKDQYYRNCAEAKEAGAAPLRRGVNGGYRPALDRDNDGIACD